MATKPTKAAAKAPAKTASKATPKKVVNPAKKPVKMEKKKVFEDTVQKKPKTVKPPIQNSAIIGKMADNITNTFS